MNGLDPCTLVAFYILAYLLSIFLLTVSNGGEQNSVQPNQLALALSGFGVEPDPQQSKQHAVSAFFLTWTVHFI